MSSDEEREIESPLHKKPRLHETHCDPCGDVILSSNDEVEFRASSFQLSKISKFFADAFSLPSPPGLDRCREPIHLDFPGNIIAIYLDLVSTPVRLQHVFLEPYQAIPENLGPLLTLAEFTLCEERIISIIRRELELACGTHPLEVLLLSSEREDIPLAQKALANVWRIIPSYHIHSSRICSPDCVDRRAEIYEKVKNIFPQLRPEFQGELFSLLLLQTQTRHETQYGDFDRHDNIRFHSTDWQRIGERFDPMRPMKSKIPMGRRIEGYKYEDDHGEDEDD